MAFRARRFEIPADWKQVQKTFCPMRFPQQYRGGKVVTLSIDKTHPGSSATLSVPGRTMEA